MSLIENPIFLTQKRLVHRGGVFAAILLAVLIGASLLAGLIAYRSVPSNFSFDSPQEAGEVFYGWTLGVEILVVVAIGFARISAVLTNERKAGLLDANRLTPMKPWELVVGYWFGPPLREIYMGAVLAGLGLVIVLLGKLSIVLWLGTQLLVLSTAMFLGLLAVLMGMVFQRPQSGGIFLVLFLASQMFSFATPKLFLTDFLLPIYGIANLFTGEQIYSDQANEWSGLPDLFGFSIDPVLLTVGLQFITGIFLWRIAVRKAGNPFQAALLRWEIIALFALLVFFQQGLIWGQWRGNFPYLAGYSNRFDDNLNWLLPVVHGGTALLAIVFLAFASPQPESIRIKAMRAGIKSHAGIFSHSSVSLAIGLTAAAGIALFTHFVRSIVYLEVFFIAVANLLAITLIFALLLEFCRLRYQRRAPGFIALWLFILCALPAVLAAVFTNSELLKFSLFAPGCAALAGGNGDENLAALSRIVAGHLCIAILLYAAWWQEWKKLLARSASV